VNAPLLFEALEDGALVPVKRFQKEAAKRYEPGQTYLIETREERSMASHGHFFASLHEAWSNLPEIEADRFQTAEHLRKWCLIKGGFADQRQIVCASKAEAQRVAAFIRPMDEYAIVVASEAVVTVYTAKSQSMRAMGKKDFAASKDAVLEIAWCLVGLTPNEAAQNVGKAA